MSGSLSLIIILIVVVWVIVLAPMVFGDKTPIRRSGEGFSETRVLHTGGTTAEVQRRKPRLSGADIHRSEEATAAKKATGGSTRVDLKKLADDAAIEAVEAVAVSIEDKKTSSAEEQPEIIDGDVVEAEEITAEHDNLEVVDELDGEDGIDGLDELELYDDDASVASEYDMDDSYESPEDYGYGSSVIAITPDAIEDDGEAIDAEGIDGDENADELKDEDETVDAKGIDGEDVDDELTEEDLALARARRGRGGWDPEAEARRRLDRAKRRQRTVMGLVAIIAVALAAAIIFGGWAWLAPVAAVALTAWYLVTLKTVVEQEKALRARRLRQLRRARLGVMSADEGAPVPAYMRRPGAVVVEIDDESADFSHLPEYSEPLIDTPYARDTRDERDERDDHAAAETLRVS